VALAYTEDSEWRNRAEFLRGRDEIRAFLRRKWARELDCRLKKYLWAFTDNRIAVRFEDEWHDDSGNWFRSYGNELWEFADTGLMRTRQASMNDVVIREDERRLR
jgi:nuclear transport factor 2 (NTF2) superfamily protein